MYDIAELITRQSVEGCLEHPLHTNFRGEQGDSMNTRLSEVMDLSMLSHDVLEQLCNALYELLQQKSVSAVGVYTPQIETMPKLGTMPTYPGILNNGLGVVLVSTDSIMQKNQNQ